MEKYAFLVGYFDKQLLIIKRIHKEIIHVNVHVYEKQFLFALRTQQFYNAIEDLFKQIAKSFENHVDTMTNFYKELLLRMNTEVPKIRPAVISRESLVLLDKVRAFRHFIRHAYDCELDEKQLDLIQTKLRDDFSLVDGDLQKFRLYLQKLTDL